MAGGTFQVVRIIPDVRRSSAGPSCDPDQENIIGRRKATGDPLGGSNEFSISDYQSDPKGLITPLTAHIRLANPRTTPTPSRILRRGYNSRGLDVNGRLDQGLLFTCHQQNLLNQFITVQGRLINGLPFFIQPHRRWCSFAHRGSGRRQLGLLWPRFAEEVALRGGSGSSATCSSLAPQRLPATAKYWPSWPRPTGGRCVRPLDDSRGRCGTLEAAEQLGASVALSTRTARSLWSARRLRRAAAPLICTWSPAGPWPSTPTAPPLPW